MRDEAEKRIGHLYPKVRLPKEFGGGEAKVNAWLWARTVVSPNPAAKGAHVPLVRSFWLSTKPGKKAWIEPVVDQSNMTYQFEVRTGEGEARPGTIGKKGDVCLLTGSPITREYIRGEGKAGRMAVRLMAIVAEGQRGRIYLSPDGDHERLALDIKPPEDVLNTEIIGDMRYLTPVSYGMNTHRSLFTRRQLVTLTAFCDLVQEARAKALEDSGGDRDYADAVATFLGMWISRFVDLNNALCQWRSDPAKQHVGHLFARQAIPIVWDFAEANSLGSSAGSYDKTFLFVPKVVEGLAAAKSVGRVQQRSATDITPNERPFVFSSDPPYYDNVPYADLSDFFYVWLRRCLQPVYPQLLGTVLVPKAEELVADQFRQGGKDQARIFFERGMGRVFERMRETSDPAFPTTIYYAFKQTEDDEGSDPEDDEPNLSRASTGWETFLQSLIDAGWQIDGTWPMRTELGNRMRGQLSNALASSIVLVCRTRPKNAETVSRRDLLAALKKELPDALRAMQKSNIAPVDLAQAAIGPGMAVFSRYSRVLETDGSAMTVRAALTEINKSLDEVLAEQEGEFDADTRWALAWFDQNGFNEGAYGMAETLCTAKNTSVQGMKDAGILEAKGGKVRLLKKEELDADWNPATDSRLTIWEITHHLIRRLEQGESGAAELIHQLGAKAEVARDLSYRLYTICERRKWAQEAIAYNALVLSWSDVQRLAQEKKAAATPTQAELI
jgi:putative DNA methylase